MLKKINLGWQFNSVWGAVMWWNGPHANMPRLLPCPAPSTTYAPTLPITSLYQHLNWETQNLTTWASPRRLLQVNTPAPNSCKRSHSEDQATCCALRHTTAHSGRLINYGDDTPPSPWLLPKLELCHCVCVFGVCVWRVWVWVSHL